MTYVPTPADRVATQRHGLFGVILHYVGKQMTPDNIDLLLADLMAEVTEGGTSWAFKETK